MDIKLKQNLARIIRTLEGQGMKTTKIAQAIGYISTRQLYNTIEGKSLLSTKAVFGLIENLNVNPSYIFLGKGDMFIADETEIEILRRENREWIQRHNEAVKTVMALMEIIKKMEKRNNDLIEISSAALKFHKSHIEGEKGIGEDLNELKDISLIYAKDTEGKDLTTNENNPQDPLNESLEIYRWLDKKQKELVKEEPKSYLKRNKK